MDNKVHTEYTMLNDLIKKELSIPDYQRPYKWKEKNVVELLDDILDSYHSGKEKYRIGTVILHNSYSKLDIVNGQQRLVTITLILNYLGEKELPLLKAEFPHADSKSNIRYNYDKIKEWFGSFNINEKSKFQTYLLTSCEFVEIELNDISEAFQLFDSQNVRGKALEPYDLLKAFHLREMDINTSEERLNCVIEWEKAADNGSLNNLAKYIYRIRKWAKGEDAGSFKKDDIDEFKGMNLNKYKDYPYLKPYMLNDALVKQNAKDSIYESFGLKIHFPFQLTQMIINGRRFFEFVAFYSDLYAKLFKDNNSEFYSFYNEKCRYQGCNRTGDIYVREMYEASVLYYFDKFGEINFSEISKLFYKWAYILRLKQDRVSYSSIDKYIRENNGNIFKRVNDAYYPKELLKLQEKVQLPQSIKKEIPEVQEVFNPTIIKICNLQS